jgi:hypothetical protein
MTTFARFAVTLMVFAVVTFADEISIPLEGGSIIIEDPRFIHNIYGSDSPMLTFALVNRTSEFWRILKLQFQMEGLCKGGERRQWSRTIVTSLGYMSEQPLSKSFHEMVTPLVGKVDGCRTEKIKATLLSAENSKVRIDGETGERVDLVAERKAQEAAEAERRRIEEGEQAKKEAEDATRRKRLTADRKKREADEQARYERAKAVEEVKAAEERAKVRTACALLYEKTANKKIGDLTVKEEQQVRSCQLLGLYRPR